MSKPATLPTAPFTVIRVVTRDGSSANRISETEHFVRLSQSSNESQPDRVWLSLEEHQAWSEVALDVQEGDFTVVGSPAVVSP